MAGHAAQIFTDDAAVVFIAGGAASTARVHQYGLRDKVDRRQDTSPTVRYARRELLGYCIGDVQAIADMLEVQLIKN